ncbi:MAG: helix-turn-helix domain-containing protein [Candidatus Methylomirabilia bacterium]
MLEATGGNQSRAAERLGIHRNTLQTKLRGIPRAGQQQADPRPSGEPG